MMDRDGAALQRLTLDTFVLMADMLSSDYEIGEFLQFLVDRTKQIMAASTVGVLLETPDGWLQLAAATSPAMELIERAEMESGEGPCMEAYQTGEQVQAPNLQEESERWSSV